MLYAFAASPLMHLVLCLRPVTHIFIDGIKVGLYLILNHQKYVSSILPDNARGYSLTFARPTRNMETIRVIV